MDFEMVTTSGFSERRNVCTTEPRLVATVDYDQRKLSRVSHCFLLSHLFVPPVLGNEVDVVSTIFLNARNICRFAYVIC